MKKRYIFSLAAMALLTAACSSDEMALNPADQPAPVEQKIPFTAVISADAAGTRALTEASDGKTITAKWEKKEKLALIHGKQIDVLEVSEVDATTGAATISGDITSPTNDESVFVVYVGHGSKNMSQLQESLTAVTEDIAEADISEAMNPMLMTQDGTLKGISDNFDFRLATAKFTVKDNKATFASEVKMPASYAIWKLNLTTDGTTALKAKQLSMQRKGDEEAHAAVDLDTETSSEFYIAFIPSAQANAYIFEATTSDDKTYSCTPTVSSTLSAGKFYRSTLTMTSTENTSYVDYSSGTASTKSCDAIVVGSTTTKWSDAAYVVKSDVTIDGNVTISGSVDLILCDGATLTVNGHIWDTETYEGSFGNGKLTIYGQQEGSGTLALSCEEEFAGEYEEASESAPIGIYVEELNVNRCEVNSTTTKAKGCAISGSIFNLYGGIVIANSNVGDNSIGIEINDSGSLKVLYGGSLTANGNYYGISCGNVINVKGTGSTLEVFAGQISEDPNRDYLVEGAGGDAIGAEKLSVSDGATVTLHGGDAKSGSGKGGGAGLDGNLEVTGGTFTSTGGAKDGSGKDGLGISNDYTITLNGVTMFEGDSANPDTVAESQTKCTCRYVIIKPAE